MVSVFANTRPLCTLASYFDNKQYRTRGSELFRNGKISQSEVQNMNPFRSKHPWLSKLVFFVLLAVSVSSVIAQKKIDTVERGQAIAMLKNVKNAIKNDYWDANYKGMDLEKRFSAAEEKIKAVDYLSQAFSIIAQAVIDLDDSHTTFYPPALSTIVEYGWKMKIYGEKAFISAVKDDSDASKKGLRVGDEVVAINGFRPNRKEFWKIVYYYQVISPKTKVVFDIKRPDGAEERLEINSDVRQLKRLVDLRRTTDANEAMREGDKLRFQAQNHFLTIGNTVVWRMSTFSIDPNDVGKLIGQAKGKDALVLDLRGNGGGYVDTLEELVGYFVDKETKIADLKGRKKMDPQKAKGKGSDVFKGKLIVLVDASSASASEIFARFMQLEKRGVVLGDVSAGAVMQSQPVNFDAGVTNEIYYGMNLTRADVIMSDGKSLEHVGVMPDELIVPTGSDIANSRDPVLARALELCGIKIGASEAGKFFPKEPFIYRTSNVVLFGDIWVF